MKQKEQLAAQEQQLEELTLKIEDVETLLDDVSDAAYDKAVEVMTDTVRQNAQGRYSSGGESKKGRPKESVTMPLPGWMGHYQNQAGHSALAKSVMRPEVVRREVGKSRRIHLGALTLTGITGALGSEGRIVPMIWSYGDLIFCGNGCLSLSIWSMPLPGWMYAQNRGRGDVVR